MIFLLEYEGRGCSLYKLFCEYYKATSFYVSVSTKHSKKIRHKTLSLKIPNVKFNFDVSDCMMQVVTDTSKISMRPYNSLQMSNST